MGPDDLNEDETIALVALTRVMVAADGQLGIEEMKELQEIGLDIGVDAFTRVSKKVDKIGIQSAEQALGLAAKVTRDDARALIRTMLVDLASTDGIDASEQDLIDRLGTLWSS